MVHRNHLLGLASEGGELLVARIRLALTAVLLLIPLSNLFSSLPLRERVMGFSVTLAALALSSIIYVLVRRDLHREWFGMATSCLDVTLVSTALAAYRRRRVPYPGVTAAVDERSVDRPVQPRVFP